MTDFEQLNVEGKRVLVRADLNVPMAGGKVSDHTRLMRLLPTLKNLANRQAKIVVLSHFGRPDGRRDETFSLRPVADALGQDLSFPVQFVADCIGDEVVARTHALSPGGILVLENLRFYPEEERNDPEFAQELARNGEYYVNDAFSASHRAHASISGLPRYLPHAMGPQLRAEVVALSSILTYPKRPLLAIVGGAKVSTKIELLANLVQKVNVLILGGGMANTFLHSMGIAVGNSLIEPGCESIAQNILAEAESHGCRVLLPQDAVVASERGAQDTQILTFDYLRPQHRIFDVGPKSIVMYERALEESRSVVWNGPVGLFEEEEFALGTMALANKIAELTEKKLLISVAGGGDTVAAIQKTGVTEKLTYVSTAGGAFLEWLEGKKLPGLIALDE